MGKEMDCAVREKTVKDEIEELEIPQEAKDRILSSLKRSDCNFSKRIAEKENEYCEKIAKMGEQLNRVKEQNISLKNACLALSDALSQEIIK